MSEPNDVPGLAAARLREWLGRRLSPEALAWLDEACTALRDGAPDRTLFLAYSGAVHRCGKDDLALDASEREAAAEAVPGWDPGGWSVEQASRALLLLALPAADESAYDRTLERLRETADVAELAALFRALPLLPHPGSHVLRAREGLRTNMTGVFEALVCRNPYPAAHLSESAWNQMVLKAVFVGSPLHEIVGLDERANPRLSRMLADYAHERWAASRAVDPELWRPVGLHADAGALADLGRVLDEGSERERKAAALALASCSAAGAREILARAPDLAGAVADGTLSWSDVHETDDVVESEAR